MTNICVPIKHKKTEIWAILYLHITHKVTERQHQWRNIYIASLYVFGIFFLIDKVKTFARVWVYVVEVAV